ncbi:penicillin acylase family protein [Roseospira marina]|uniref:Penicillin acylase family protein n=1 Tax=Roseospira marina TaxID=140057 RepID=A0A5M6IGL1_9PROT|nr:penicillin acylase family protein [Roseospira marina]KAA5606718.1 penicillin acylase family protein [Roseospira marina]MBB4313867.1 penicillin amidase [Roseospira marina]MBB5087029.1 penicillin amidase [Roseospira marina]
MPRRRTVTPRGPRWLSWLRAPLVGLSALATAACGLLTPLPEPTALEDRLSAFPTANLPLDGPVTVHWAPHQIPFIEATSDADAAFTLGLVHAHLRLGQMETARRLSQGRVAEMAGPIPFVLDLDHALRVLGFDRAAPDILAAMPEASRTWLTRFTDGINHYLMTVEDLPHDFAVLGLEREPWRPEEILTIGRLAGTDINWLKWVGLLKQRDRPDFATLLDRELRYGGLAPSSAAAVSEAADLRSGHDRALTMLTAILSGWGRGSNSLALAGSRTASGAPMIASDPHLGVSQPNLWLIAGVKSPSLHVVGLMPVALPLFALGRTPDIAWGGTNMRAASSDLVDVSDLPPDAFTRETHALGVRYWFDTERESRVSPYGPVLSDAPLLPFGEGETVALRWIGHTVTDEITALLQAARTDSLEDFRAALAPFGVSAQNFVYADRSGTIGLVAATQIPRRSADAPTRLIQPPDAIAAWWEDIASTADMPMIANPDAGFVASANNPPGASPFPIGWFFSSPDRIERLTEVVHGRETPWTVDALADLQTDTLSRSALALRDALAERMDTTQTAHPVWRQIAAWDGRYDGNSRGALAFQAFLAPFAATLWEALDRPQDWDGGDGKWRILEVVGVTDDAALGAAVQDALAAAEAPLAEYETWGDVHRLSIATVLGTAPIIGGRYRFGTVPVGGGQETLMKAAHPETVEPHTVRYGAQTRHISDMADPDANYFVLLGGQDGWFNSTTQFDQIDLWRQGTLVQVPLRPETVAAGAAVTHHLRPTATR